MQLRVKNAEEEFVTMFLTVLALFIFNFSFLQAFVVLYSIPSISIIETPGFAVLYDVAPHSVIASVSFLRV